MAAVVALLSLLVSMDVFLALRQPGLTLAGDADCGIMEHTHGDECGTQLCICNLEGTTHVHDAACYETRRVDAREERQLMCSETETLHTHNGNCYETVIAPKTETVLLCENQDADHSHGDTCYKTVEADGPKETVLKCDLVYEPHQHTDACFVTQTIDAHEEQILICVLSEGIHTHSETCYKQEMTCGYEEHVHSIDCYSDKTADTETMLDWQRMFADYPYTGDLRRDLVGIAKTQVGYCESTRNFEIGQDGISRGYTRYGAWYGAPYSDWSAMFVSFCLHYAGADPAQAPGNTGAASMAQLWNNLGKYVPSGDYVPQTGDLVFFTDNTVGIATEVYHTAVYVVRGDVGGCVSADIMPLTDSSIAGWGLTDGTLPPEEETEPLPKEDPELPPEEDPELPPEEIEPAEGSVELPPEEELTPEIGGNGYGDIPDVSNGPVFLIYANEAKEEARPWGRFMTWAARTDGPEAVEADISGISDLLAYLNKNSGSYFFTLLDKNNHELPKDANGNYIAQADTGYKLTISFNSPEGFLPGTYQYQVPNGLLVDGGEGTFILKDNTNVGSWVVTDTGLITLVFNEHMNSRTEITISATLGIHFPEQEEPIDFDGKITVVVQEPPQQILSTEVEKWGSQGNPAHEGKTDPAKIYWTVQIAGNRDSDIPGSVVTDRVLSYDWSHNHRYTQSDIAAGLSFGASVIDSETGEELYWHRWTAGIDDPALTWDETGWSYEMPEVIVCQSCGETVTLGNEHWTYYVEYSSTPDATNIAGGLAYTNRVEVDNQSAEGWAQFTQTEVHGDVYKNGSFVSDAGGGRFLWELQVTLPGRKTGEKAFRDWFINDIMTVRDQYGTRVTYAPNDIHLATVTANYHGKTITVPRIQDATENDPYAWMLNWSNDQGGNGFYDLRQIYILCRCDCTDDSCGIAGGCWNYYYTPDNGGWVESDYCPCWTETEDTTFTFTYETKDSSAISGYGNMGYSLQNEVLLANAASPEVAQTHASIPIPSVLKKELTHDFNGYTANYKVTVNESKLMLTNGSPLTIHDVMTDTLAYISGSLVITTEDANGNIKTLRQDVDYDVYYDGTGNATNDSGDPVHVLDIVIRHPQPVMYILDYDATLIMPEQVTEGIKYQNSAAVTLWGQDIKDATAEKVYAEINIAAKSYQVELYKTAALTGEPLPGATFGLYNEHGGLITSEVTDGNGELFFQTNIVEGIILREHVLYYMQEMRAPPGYQLDDTKHWFCFCSEVDASCPDCAAVTAGTDASRIPFEQIGKVHATNEIMSYDLPSTGGAGIYHIISVGVGLILTPLIYGSIRRRKQERRGVG